eukprot:6174266-Pleurochrysis_carterae.AAC.1
MSCSQTCASARPSNRPWATPTLCCVFSAVLLALCSSTCADHSITNEVHSHLRVLHMSTHLLPASLY